MHPLDPINKSELIEMCRTAQLGNFGRNSSREELYRALEDGICPDSCPLEEKRELMETHIKKNFRRIRTQLPGCNGTCVSYGCPDIIVQKCWENMKNDML